MRRVPWHLAFRAGRKGAMTAAGVALAVAFSVASFSVAHGLEGDILGLARNFPGDSLVVRSSDGAPFEMSRLAEFPEARGVILRGGVSAAGDDVVVLSFVGPAAPAIAPGVARGPPLGSVRVGDVSLAVEASPPDKLVPTGWLVANASSFGAMPTSVSHALVPNATAANESRLESLGFVVERAPALQSFFRTSGLEIARDLFLVVAFSSVLSMLFCYEFLRSEVRERRREIGVWRAIGMRPADVVRIFLLRSAVIASVGFLVGTILALGAIAVASGSTESNLFVVVLTPAELVVLGAAFLGAALMGALLPAMAAGRIGVQQALESAP